MSKKLLQIFLFITLSIVSIALILYLTASRETLEALRNLRIGSIVMILSVWFFALSADALAISFLVRGVEEDIGLIASYRVAAIRIFFNAVTPFCAGGQPVMIYALSREGVPGGKSSSVVVMKLISLAAFNQLGAITAFVFFHRYISDIPAVNTAFLAAGIIFVSICGLLIYLLLKPGLLIPLVNKIGKLLMKLRIVKDVKDFHRKVIREARHARRSFKAYFGHRSAYLILGALASALMYLAEVAMLWVILLGLGVELSFVQGLTLSALLLFLLAFMPTPGSAGLGEAIFVIIFAGEVPTYLLGVAVILWRLFYRYLSAGLGALFSARSFSRIVVKKLN